MTHREDRTSMDRVISVLAEEGFDGMAEAIATLMNEAMKLERSEFLGAEPCIGKVRNQSWHHTPDASGRELGRCIL